MRLSHALATLTVLCLAATGCPRSSRTMEPTYDISGLEDDAAAAEIIDSLCDWSSRCGMAVWSCGSSASGDIECTAEIEPVSYEECAATADEEEIAESLTCADLDTEEAELVNDCLNAMERTVCLTQEDLDTMVAEVEAGVEPTSAGPVECEALEDLFEDCEGDDPPESSSGVAPDPAPDSGSDD